MKVTAQDLAFADAFLDATSAKDKKAARKSIATLLAAIHDRAVLCASVRLEREYGLVQRALLPQSGGVSDYND